jgi:SAM-dependent methyltransferase
MTTTDREHDRLILEQFTRQADPFADLAAHSAASSMRLVLAAAAVGPGDEVLDVACGPGLLTCALARAARRVVGVDVVPAMLERARKEQSRAGLTNVTWQPGDARALPFAEATFDRVVTRFSFHHLLDPAQALGEMVRVCRPGGIVMVVDAAPAAEARAAYDEWETLRDPSHARALTLPELEALCDAAGLTGRRSERFRLEMELEAQLAASFPQPGDGERLRARFREDIARGVDRPDLGAHLRGDGAVWFAYPCAIVTARR